MTQSAPVFDPFLVEILDNELGSIADEMATTISRSGSSVFVRSMDYAVALCDGHGRPLGHGAGTAFHPSLFEKLVQNVIELYDAAINPGDVFISNDPYAGASHMPDVAIVAPVFVDDELVAFSAAISHHSDAGGRFAGSAAAEARSAYEEGVRIPLTKIYSRNQRNEGLLDLVKANVRVPDEWEADMEAKIAGCRRAATGILGVIDRHGLDTFRRACDYLMERNDRAVRAAIAAVPDGVYTASDVLDLAHSPGEQGEVKLTLTVRGDHLIADFTGSADQLPDARNMSHVMTVGAVFGAVHAGVVRDSRVRLDLQGPIEIIAPLGSIVNAEHPAAVGARGPLLARTFDVMFMALAKAMGDDAPGGGDNAVVLSVGGVRQDGSPFVLLDLLFGSWAARATKDGIDGCPPLWTGSLGAASAELVEQQAPVVIEEFGFTTDTGGPGRFRGGVSVARQWRLLVDGEASISRTRVHQMQGRGGGEPGAMAELIINPKGSDELRLPSHTHDQVELAAGSRVLALTSGSPGFGDALSREAEAVAKDVREGFVSVAAARERYGVVFGPEADIIDGEATFALRQTLRIRAGKGNALRGQPSDPPAQPKGAPS